jgi:hypothetical protein
MPGSWRKDNEWDITNLNWSFNEEYTLSDPGYPSVKVECTPEYASLNVLGFPIDRIKISRGGCTVTGLKSSFKLVRDVEKSGVESKMIKIQYTTTEGKCLFREYILSYKENETKDISEYSVEKKKESQKKCMGKLGKW